MGEQNCLRFPNPFAFLSSSSVVKIGDKIPAAPLFEKKFGDPDAKLNMVDYTANRKVAVVGLPGAFTPT
jgi:peroxiredoxin